MRHQQWCLTHFVSAPLDKKLWAITLYSITIAREVRPAMKTIGSEWAEFSSTVINPKAPAVQRHEMKTAFYAGAVAVFAMLVTQVSPGDEVQESDLAMMDGMKKELEDFAASLRG